MAASVEHPSIQFVRAKGYTTGRALGPPLWIVWHDMEASETSTRAEATANYFADPGDGRRVSAHYCVDDNSAVQCVYTWDSAWTVGNTQGNYRGINIELSGFARQGKGEWLDDFGRAMFAVIAPIVRADCERYGIPMRWLTDAQVRAGEKGFTTHVQLGRVFGGSDHTDPGPAFPYEYVLAVMRGETEQEGRDMFVYRVEGDGASPPLYVSDGTVRRVVPATPGGGAHAPGNVLRAAGATDMGLLKPGDATPAKYAEMIGGPLVAELVDDEGDGGGSSPGDGVSADEVRDIVRDELDNTQLSRKIA